MKVDSQDRKTATGSRIKSLMSPPPGIQKDTLLYYRERILFVVLSLGVALGIVVFIPSTIMVIKENTPGLWWCGFASFLSSVLMLVFRGIDYRLRASVTLFWGLALGSYIIMKFGFLSGGPFWLFSFAVLAGLLLGLKAAVGTLIVNGLVMAGFAWMIGTGQVAVNLPVFPNWERVAAAWTNFMFLNTVTAVSASTLIRWLQSLADREKDTSERLRKERFELMEARERMLNEIDERKKTEKALRDSEDRLRVLFEYAPDGYYLVDTEGRFMDFNRTAETITGYSRAELIGKDIRETGLLSDDQIPRAIENLDKSLEGLEDGPSEFAIIRKDGSTRDIEIRTYPVKIENSMHILGIARDITDRKRSERLLNWSESQLRTIFDTLPIGMFLGDLTGHPIQINRAWAEMTGYSAEKLNQMDSRMVTHPEERTHRDYYINAVAGGELDFYRTEKRYIRKDGSILWGDLFVAPVKDKDGNIQALIGATVDITQRKEAEIARLESEQRYRTLFENAQVGLYRSRTSDGKTLEINQRGAEIFGYASMKECLENFVASKHYANPMDRRQMLDDLRVNGEIVNREAEMLRKDGSRIWVRASARFFPDKDYHEGVLVDITEEKKAVQALQVSEELYRRMFEESPMPLFIQDFSAAKKRMDELVRSGVKDIRAHLQANLDEIARLLKLVKVTRTNRATRELYQAENESEMLQSLDRFVPDNLLPIYCNQFSILYEGAQIYEGAGQNLTLKGDLIDALARKVVLPGSENDLSGVLTAIVDLTEIRRAFKGNGKNWNHGFARRKRWRP